MPVSACVLNCKASFILGLCVLFETFGVEFLDGRYAEERPVPTQTVHAEQNLRVVYSVEVGFELIISMLETWQALRVSVGLVTIMKRYLRTLLY
jgi:hypothetical protein